MGIAIVMLVIPGLVKIPVIIVVPGTDLAVVIVSAVAMPAITGVIANHASGGWQSAADQGAGP
jgi:hypothetical protein